jgi:AcrR family transcriptional regulator
MKGVAELIPAPKRGRYDRTLSRHARQAEQRDRVIAAIVSIATSGRELSVANVIEHAGIGRNTFYEYFDDVEHALRAIDARARGDLVVRVEAALRVARTPLERVRALARAWSESLLESPSLARFALRSQAPGLDAAELSGLGRYVATVLEAEVEFHSALPGLSDRLRTTAVAALFDTVSRVHLATRAAVADELQRLLTELSMRLLR